MEAFRALALLAEPPREAHRPVLEALGLGELVDEAAYTDVLVLQLPPYASIYLGAEGMIGGEARDRVAGFWRALGLAPPDEPDHLTVMLATYAELGDHERRDPARGDAWGRARRAFLWEHLLSWLPPYLEAVGDLGVPFYGRWAKLLASLLRREARAVPPLDRPSLHLAGAPAVGSHDLDALVAGLLAPARSGVILTRRDLARAAADLGLGARTHERRRTLRDLLEESPDPTLAWLASEVDRWSARHRLRQDARDPVTGHWVARAQATRAILDSLREEAGHVRAAAR
jgi:hypothetical protein